jgi:hypothetical protein
MLLGLGLGLDKAVLCHYENQVTNQLDFKMVKETVGPG